MSNKKWLTDIYGQTLYKKQSSKIIIKFFIGILI